MVIQVMALPDLVYKHADDCLADPSSLVIACTSYDERYASFTSERFLLLYVDDVTNPERARSFKPKHGQMIAQCVEDAIANNLVKRIIAACDGGVSRSAAVAAALMLRFGQDDETALWSNPAYSPNELIYKVLCEELGIQIPEGALHERLKRSERARQKLYVRHRQDQI